MPTVALPAPTGANDSAALTTWFDTLAAGTTIEADGGDTYRLDNTLAIVDLDGFIFNGNGVTFQRTDAPGRTGSLISITGGDGWEWHDTTIIGANPNGGVDGDYIVAKESHHCLFVSGALNFRITGCEMHHGFGDCLYLSRRKIGPAGVRESYVWCTGGIVDACKLHHSGRQLLTTQGAEDCIIENCDLWEARRSTWEIEPNIASFNGVNNMLMHLCRIGAGRFAVITNTGSGPCDNVTFRDNLLARSLLIVGEDGDGGRRAGWEIIDNRFITALNDSPEVPVLATCAHHGSPSGCQIDLTRYDDVVITGNEANLDTGRTPSMVFVTLTDCANPTVSGNDVVEVVGGDGPTQCNVVGPGEPLREIDVPVEPVSPPGTLAADWSYQIGAAMLVAALSCEAECDRHWVSDGGRPEQPPPGCPCQLVAVVTEGLEQSGQDPIACGLGRFASVTMVLDLCTEVAGRDEIPNPVSIGTRAQENASIRWLILAGIQRAWSLGLLTVDTEDPPLPTFLQRGWRITPGEWRSTWSTGGSARFEMTWRFATDG